MEDLWMSVWELVLIVMILSVDEAIDEDGQDSEMLDSFEPALPPLSIDGAVDML